MNLVIFTLVLNGGEFIKRHLPIFEQLALDWHWIIVHGTAQNNGSTAWCHPQEPGLSTDGTTEYLKSIASHDRVLVIEKSNWESKDEMVNAALAYISGPSALMQIDADEIHSPQNIERIVSLFESEPVLGAVKMRCRYFVGPDIVCRGRDCWSDMPYDWQRAWRFNPGMTFLSHEPPQLSATLGRQMEKDESDIHGLTFDHMAYVNEAQVAHKEQFYNYRGLTNQWRALQANTHWPAKLSRFFTFVEKTLVERVDILNH